MARFSATYFSIALEKASEEIARLLLDTTQGYAPTDTGAFGQGLDVEIVGDPAGQRIEVFSTVDVPLMEWTIEGTFAHEIGMEGQFLYNPDTDFAAVGPVEHPGTPPNPWAEEALHAVEQRAHLILTKWIRDAMIR